MFTVEKCLPYTLGSGLIHFLCSSNGYLYFSRKIDVSKLPIMCKNKLGFDKVVIREN